MSFRYRTFNTDGSTASNQTLYWRYAATFSCQAAEEAFNDLTLSQRLSQSQTSAPTQSGYQAVSRNCTVTVTDSGDFTG